MILEFDIKTEFDRHCGADVKYVDHAIRNQHLYIEYQVTGVDNKRSITAMMQNGTNTSRRDTARRIAKRAFDDAYHLTGKRDADMKQLLQGKTV